MRNKVIQGAIAGQVFALHPKAMSSLLEFANSETPRAVVDNENSVVVANNSVEYEVVGTVGVISVDGGMYKKGVSGLCSSIASYEQIINAIDNAEANPEVKTILFRVDTVGGSVAGVDEVYSRIKNSPKKTVTLYENIGASAGIWAFIASDEVYATEVTQLGSIGVVVTYFEGEDDNKYVDIVSKNAQNKRCSLNGDCKEKIQRDLNKYEELFYARVKESTGFTTEQIKTVFNNGDVIFASEAYQNGFINGIITFRELLNSLEATPTAKSDKSILNNTIGDTAMEFKFDRENLNATEQLFNALVANKETLENRLSLNADKLAEAEKQYSDLEAEYGDLNEKLSALKDDLTRVQADVQADFIARLEEAQAHGVGLGVALEMIKAGSAKEATEILLKAKETVGATTAQEKVVAKDEDVELQEKLASLDVTFV